MLVLSLFRTYPSNSTFSIVCCHLMSLDRFCNEHNEMLIEIKAYPWNLEESSKMSRVIWSSWQACEYLGARGAFP